MYPHNTGANSLGSKLSTPMGYIYKGLVLYNCLQCAITSITLPKKEVHIKKLYYKNII